MLLDTPTIVIIIIFTIINIITMLIYILRNRNRIVIIIRRIINDNYILNNSVGIDTGTANCSEIDENEKLDEIKDNNDIFNNQHEIRFADIV